MSAYICDKEHIVYLVAAAMSTRINPHGGPFRWRYNDESHKLPGDFDRAAEVANMLWCENIKSVSHRYPNESSASLPGPIGKVYVTAPEDFPVFARIDPIEVLSAVACYEYQSCEHPEWRDSEAFAFCESLKESAFRVLPGYERAEWGEPKDFKLLPKRRGKLTVFNHL